MQDAQEAYEEAVNAVFVLQVDCHRHTQPRQTHQGSVRWEMMEMWPMQVCHSGFCFALVARLAFGLCPVVGFPSVALFFHSAFHGENVHNSFQEQFC